VVFLVYLEEWGQAAVMATLWLLLFWAYRRFRLGTFFEVPLSYL
jgi:cell division protein FtsW (lipid II flippase)